MCANNMSLSYLGSLVYQVITDCSCCTSDDLPESLYNMCARFCLYRLLHSSSTN